MNHRATAEFINLKDFQMPNISFTIQENIPITVLNLPFKRYINFESEVWEWNFRMIDSYLPEVLYLLANENNGRRAIKKCIGSLSKKTLYKSQKFSKIYLTIKMFQWLEAMLFSDLFNGVHKGVWLSNRCYTAIEHGELNYYTLLNSRKLVDSLLDVLALYFTGGKFQLCFINDNHPFANRLQCCP